MGKYSKTQKERERVQKSETQCEKKSILHTAKSEERQRVTIIARHFNAGLYTQNNRTESNPISHNENVIRRRNIGNVLTIIYSRR